MEENVDLDAALLQGSLLGSAEECMLVAMHCGLGYDEALARLVWLKSQPDEYLDRVIAKVEGMKRHEST